MINIKKALYHAWRFTYPSDNMDYVHGEWNYQPVKPLNYSPLNPVKIFPDKFNEDYAPEIEEILSDLVTLISGILALPNEFGPSDKSPWAKIKRIGWNMLGWEDSKPLWLNILRSPFSLIKHLVIFVFMFPVNILKLVSELLPLFLFNLCDQAAQVESEEQMSNWNVFFGFFSMVPLLFHFIGRAATSPVENARFYLNASYDLFNRRDYGAAVGAMLLGFSSVALSSIIIFACPYVFANVGLIGIATLIAGYATSLKATAGVIALAGFYQEFARIAGRWWKNTMNTRPVPEEVVEDDLGRDIELEDSMEEEPTLVNGKGSKKEFAKSAEYNSAYAAWKTKKDEEIENQDNVIPSKNGQFGNQDSSPPTDDLDSGLGKDTNPFSMGNNV